MKTKICISDDHDDHDDHDAHDAHDAHDDHGDHDAHDRGTAVLRRSAITNPTRTILLGIIQR